MKQVRTKQRRATVLLMVISVLALLFVIVTGYLNLARFDRGSLVEVQRGREIDAVVATSEQTIVNAMRSQWLDDNERLFGGSTDDGSRYSLEDIPGYRGSHWLAGSEPVYAWRLNPTVSDPPSVMPLGFNMLPFQQMASIRYPGVTAMTPQPVIGDPADPLEQFAKSRPTILDLVPNYSWNSDPGGFPTIDPFDVAELARNSFMDADADGVPDSNPVLTGLLTTSANSMTGSSVPLPNTFPLAFDYNVKNNPAGDPQAYSNLLSWEQFFNSARYEVPARVISNGGKVALHIQPPPDNPTRPDLAWNAPFVLNMFEWVRRSTGSSANVNSIAFYNRVADLTREQASAEAVLAQRGGYGPDRPRGLQYFSTDVPTSVAWFEQTFPEVMLNQQGLGLPGRPAKDGLRYNLADADQWQDWSRRTQLNAALYNRGSGLDGQSWFGRMQNYDRRHLLTAVSYSDELARKLDDDGPSRNWPTPPTFTGPGTDRQVLGTQPGQTKFYLGDLEDCFYLDGNNHWRFYDIANPQAYGSPALRQGAINAYAIVQRLVNTYYDMLAAHDWTDDNQTPNEVNERREQALMLAANTLGFATPRSADGFIDTPYVIDPTNGERYWGYTPQPYLTEVAVHHEAEELGGDGKPTITISRFGLGIELYNPHDSETPIIDPAVDEFDLNMQQFGIRVGNGNPRVFTPAEMGRTPAETRLPGRRFMTISVRGSQSAPNNAFDFDEAGADIRGVGPDGRIGAIMDNIQINPISATNDDVGVPPSSQVIRVELVKRVFGADGTPYFITIDRLSVDINSAANRNDNEWWQDVARRDTTPDPFLGMFGGPTPSFGYRWFPARWRVVTGVAAENSADVNEIPQNQQPISLRASLGRAGPTGDPTDLQSILGVAGTAGGLTTPIPYSSLNRAAPPTPMITMNALPRGALAPVDQTRVAGSVRPTSFPTPGFLLFIPRFCHRGIDSPMSEIMGRLLDDAYPTLARAPVDFGHMPLFDNLGVNGFAGMRPRGGSYFDEENAGRIPWGQLVFDYFTTLNLNDPNGDGNVDDQLDPLRVPGKININTASWYVLAGLPVLDPFNGNHISLTASPEFWDGNKGIVVGSSSHGLFQFAVPEPSLPRFIGQRADNLNRRVLGGLGPIGLPSWDEFFLNGLNANNGAFRLGSSLAQAAAAYRDRIQYVPTPTSSAVGEFNESGLFTNGETIYYQAAVRNEEGAYARRYRTRGQSSGTLGVGQITTVTPDYGLIRGQSLTSNQSPSHYGFLTVGELLNVFGFDSSAPSDLTFPYGPLAFGEPRPAVRSTVGRRDFVKAVSLVALLDSQFLTTRSNTFTVYTTVMDREQPETSVHSQLTVDRSNMLPRLATDSFGRPAYIDPDNNPITANVPLITRDRTATPATVVKRRSGYFGGGLEN